METLTFATSKAFDQIKEEIRDMIGIQIPFRYPFFLFFSIEDLTDPTEDNIYFVGYEMKSPGPAFWGFIDKDNYHITIYGSCIYRTNLLNNIVKQWGRNNLTFTGSSIKNKQYPRLQYAIDNLDQIYYPNFSDFEEEKYMASYIRGEIEKKDLPRDIDENKLKKFLSTFELLDEMGRIQLLKKIDYKNSYVPISLDGDKFFNVPKILVTPDYERYKAFYAFLRGIITEKQFRKLYPWEYTLDVLDDLMYDFFHYPRGKGIEEDGYFWQNYMEDKELFLDELLNQIHIYEDQMNRVDTAFQTMKNLLDVFFEAIQTKKLKIIPTENCPAITDCERLSGDIDTTDKSCMIYYYPEGLKRGNLK
jgi:hypothetical protein